MRLRFGIWVALLVVVGDRTIVRTWGWVRNRVLVSLRARLMARAKVRVKVVLGVGLVFGECQGYG